MIIQADKDHCSQETKADYQLNRPRNSIEKRKKTIIHDETIEPEIKNGKFNNHTSR